MNSKAYFFVNHLYMSEKQFGIQSTHCLGEMMVKYLSQNLTNSPTIQAHSQATWLLDWASIYKKVIFLRGYNCKNLLSIQEKIKNDIYPWASFFEDEDSLNGAITCVGIIVPEKIHGAPKDENEFMWYVHEHNLNDFEVDLARLIVNSSTV